MEGLIAYALAKKLTASVVAGVSGMSVDGQTLIIECTDGTHLEMDFPTPKDGVSVEDVAIDENGHLICTMSDGTEIDAGELPGGSGSGSLEDALTTSVTVGGISSGTSYEAGTSLETLFRDMLNPTAYPTLTNPSASLTATGTRLLETGATQSTVFTLTLNRGSINPQYTAESSYRSGAATSYTFDGETTTTNSFTRTITSAKTSYQGSIAYAAGCQPKDSTGANYSSPLPAGSVNSNTLTWEFVDALWANTSNIATVAKLSLVSKSAKTYTFEFPAQTVANPEQFHVSASWNVTSIEALNTLSGQWEDVTREFTQGTATHNDAAGNPVSYKTFTDNRGYNAGSRKVRIKWS